MSTPTLEIADPGMYTTVQDRGRYGYQRYGVPVSGAMDQFALRAANLLVGNDEGAAALEMTVIGPSVRFLSDTWIAMTGADLSAHLNGEPLPRWQTVEVAKGGELSFQGMQDGLRAYLAVAGGIDVPVVMGSRSTHVQAGIGGYQGRSLNKGDVISTLPSGDEGNPVQRTLPDDYTAPVYGDHHELRIILGPQHSAFNSESISTVLNSTYAVSLESDRMGYKLEGPPIRHESGPDIVSDGNPLCAIQVTGDGVATILLADRGTTGGYAKIATVIGADIGTLAQAVPGHSITYKSVGVEEAHRALRRQEAVLSGIPQIPAEPSPPSLTVLVDGEAFEALDEDGETVSQTEAAEDYTPTMSRRVRASVDGHSYEFEVEVRRDDSAGK